MNLPRILDLIESVTDTKVLYMGETIQDEYRFCTAIGKPSKEPCLAVRVHKAEIYDGGVIAATRHGANFCKASQLTTSNIIRKIRYVDENYNRKLFEAQYIEDAPNKLPLPAMINDYDVLAVCDFGHGMFNNETVGQLSGAQKFLAVACQTNAANSGFNLLTKYSRADYVVIDEPEARLAARDRDSAIKDVMYRLMLDHEGVVIGKLIVTHGRHGAYGLHCKHYVDGAYDFVHMPAMTSNIIDTMGAGDAFFAVTAPMAPKACIEDLLVIGNAAGALKCGVLGHRQSVTKEMLIQFLRAHGTD